jgi:hypothetical protein
MAARLVLALAWLERTAMREADQAVSNRTSTAR